MSGSIFKKKGLVPAALAGLGGAVLLTGLLCLPLAALICRGTLPLALAAPGAALAAGLSVFAAALVVCRLRGRQPIPTAGCIAGGIVLLGMLIGALSGRGVGVGPGLLRLCIAAAAGGLLGAVMSIGQNPHKKTRPLRR